MRVLNHLDYGEFLFGRYSAASPDARNPEDLKLTRQRFVQAWKLDGARPETYAVYEARPT